jgi:uncharacterized membrane protein YwzB
MSLTAGIVIGLGIVVIVLAVFCICVAFNALKMILDDYMNGPKVHPEQIPYSERTVQGGQIEKYYVDMLKEKGNK